MGQQEIIDFLKQHKQDFAERYGVITMGLFGSCSRATQTESSDIDIAVELKQPDMFCLIVIKNRIEDAFGKSVDVIRLRPDMNPLLRSRILKDIIYV